MISDSNRSVATLAITTLLKTGAEGSVDRLMKQIATFVNEISDEFKIVVVQVTNIIFLIIDEIFNYLKYYNFRQLQHCVPNFPANTLF